MATRAKIHVARREEGVSFSEKPGNRQLWTSIAIGMVILKD